MRLVAPTVKPTPLSECCANLRYLPNIAYMPHPMQLAQSSLRIAKVAYYLSSLIQKTSQDWEVGGLTDHQ